MIFYLVALAALCCWGLRFSRFREDYMGKDQTNAFKGIFAMLILLSHVRTPIRDCLSFDDTGNQLYFLVFTRLGQMTVVPFFFYSGYGIMQSVQKKPRYGDRFFKNRILKFLIGYNIVTLVLGILCFLIGQRYPLQNYLLAWSGWKTIGGYTGNGNWYIFDQLVLYMITFGVLQLFRKLQSRNEKKYRIIVMTSVFFLSALFMAVLYILKGTEDYWYNTLMSYPFGMLYAVFKDKIDGAMKKNWAWIIALIAIAVGVGLIFLSGWKDAITYSVMGFLFILFVTLITMRVRIVNPVLKWLGGLSFGIYILQRPFMLLFESFGLDQYPVLFTACCIAATLLASIAHKWVSDKAGKLLDRKKVKA